MILIYLTHFMPLTPLITPENIRKPLVFWCFRGVSKEISGMKWAKTTIRISKPFDCWRLATLLKRGSCKGVFQKVINFTKKRTQHSCFPIKFAYFLRTRILKNVCNSYFRLLCFLWKTSDLCKNWNFTSYTYQSLPAEIDKDQK